MNPVNQLLLFTTKWLCGSREMVAFGLEGMVDAKYTHSFTNCCFNIDEESKNVDKYTHQNPHQHVFYTNGEKERI